MFSKLRDAHFFPSISVLDLYQRKGESSDSLVDSSSAEELSASQQENLSAFYESLREKGLLQTSTTDADLLRFLRARSFDISNARVMYEAMVNWRKEIGADSIVESFQFPERKTVKELYPHFHHKTDKHGRPIYIEKIGQLQLEDILKITTMDRMLLYHIKEWEILINWKFPACSKKAGYPIMQSLTILDLKGVALKNMNKQVRSFIQKVTKIDQDYYPEYLGTMFIVNAPTAFKAVWSMIKPWLDKSTQKKIEVHGSNFAPKLLEFVDPENLPEFLGGSCQCAEGCEHSDAGPWQEIPYALCYDSPNEKNESSC